MTERRFNEAEVAAIFERATEAEQSSQLPRPSSEGMTLAQIQEIGREVGISPEQVNYAARTIEAVGQPASRKFLGLPIGVGLDVDLGRKLSDGEWERFVVDLRETFAARGKLTQQGSLRQWTNGNLQALVEPTETGDRIRLRTVKGDARGMMVGGGAMLGFAAISAVTGIVSGTVGDPSVLSGAGTFAAIGAAMLGIGGLQLPRWARLRRRQMEDVATRIAAAPIVEPNNRLK